MKLWLALPILAVVLVLDCPVCQVEGRILTECELAAELQRSRISRVFISTWICIAKAESGLDTRLVTGPKVASSYSFGIFQISSLKYCSRGHSGGLCNKRCEDFANDDIMDDIACAKRIYDTEGFKASNAFLKKCKNKPLPNIGRCRR